MKKEGIIYIFVGLLVGVVITWSLAAYAVNGDHPSMMRAMGMRYSQSHMNSGIIPDTEYCSSTRCNSPAD